MSFSLDDFLGMHRLTGVDFSEEASGYGIGCVMYIRIDGSTFIIREDPVDGYRSCLRDIELVTDYKFQNSFSPVSVIGVWGMDEAVIEMNDAQSGLSVLEFGTEYADDYYPCFVARFSPNNMSININYATEGMMNSDDEKLGIRSRQVTISYGELLDISTVRTGERLGKIITVHAFQKTGEEVYPDISKVEFGENGVTVHMGWAVVL